MPTYATSQDIWIAAYWSEMGHLTELVYATARQVNQLLSDRVFLNLLYSFAT